MYNKFEVTGYDDDFLVEVLMLKMGRTSLGALRLPKAFYLSKDKGLVFCSYYKEGHNTEYKNLLGEPESISFDQLIVVIKDYIRRDCYTFGFDEEGAPIPNEDCTLGWRIYIDSVGYVGAESGGTDHTSMFAVKPYWYYFGK